MYLKVILNGTRQKTERFRRWEQLLSQYHQVEVISTQYAGHAEELARAAAGEQPAGILAAGGDGTLHQVLNGLMQFRTDHADVPQPALGIVPLGTGNDFATLCGIRQPEDLIERLKTGGKPTDCGMISSSTGIRYFINVASAGMGPDVVRRLERDSRWLGPNLTYLRAIVSSFFGYRPEHIVMQDGEGNWNNRIRVLAVANGRHFGSGIWVAPEALPDDGKLHTFAAADVPLISFLYFLSVIKRGGTIRDKRARYGSGNTVRLDGSEDICMEADGELVCRLPAEIRIMPQAITFFR